MIENTHIINALPLVADALGRKYGVKVYIGGEGAYTNGKDIHIPSLPIDADENVLKLARGYLDHEAAHLRVTDFDTLKEARLTDIEHHIWNIIEDFMVEQQLAAIYPGCRENFTWLARHLFLMEADMLSVDENPPASVIFNWFLISLRALTVPELENERARLAVAMDQHYPSLRSQLEPIVREIPVSCASTRDCIAMARTIVSLLKGYAASQKPEKTNENSKEKPDNPANANTGSDDQDQRSAGKSREGSHASAESPNKADDENNAENQPHVPNVSEKDKNSANVGKGDKGTAVDSLQEVLDDPSGLESLDIGGMTGKRLEDIHQHGSRTSLTVAVSKPFTGLPLADDEVAEIRRTTTALRTRLDALLQAQVLVRNRIGHVGRVDMRRLARIAVNDAKIFARRGIKQGIHTAIHILLDASASMQYGGRITLACHACYAVADALQHISGVGVAVTSFPNGPCPQNGREPVRWATVAPILTHKQRIHPRFKIPCNGGTPLAEAVWWVLQQLCSLEEKLKLLLILSDGEPDNADEAKNAIRACHAYGAEVYGIGIQTTSIRGLLPEEQTRVIHDLNELAPAMFDLLRMNLLKNKKGGRHENAA